MEERETGMVQHTSNFKEGFAKLIFLANKTTYYLCNFSNTWVVSASVRGLMVSRRASREGIHLAKSRRGRNKGVLKRSTSEILGFYLPFLWKVGIQTPIKTGPKSSSLLLLIITHSFVPYLLFLQCTFSLEKKDVIKGWPLKDEKESKNRRLLREIF